MLRQFIIPMSEFGKIWLLVYFKIIKMQEAKIPTS